MSQQSRVRRCASVLLAALVASSLLIPQAKVASGQAAPKKPDAITIEDGSTFTLFSVEEQSTRSLHLDGVDGHIVITNILQGMYLAYQVTIEGGERGVTLTPADLKTQFWDQQGFLPPGEELTYRVRFTSMDQKVTISAGPDLGSVPLTVIIYLLHQLPGTEALDLEDLAAAVFEVGTTLASPENSLAAPLADLMEDLESLQSNPSGTHVVIDSIKLASHTVELVTSWLDFLVSTAGETIVKQILTKAGLSQAVAADVLKHLANYEILYDLAELIVDDVVVITSFIANGGEVQSHIYVKPAREGDELMPPATPSELAPIGQSSSTRPELSWIAPPRAASFHVEISPVGDFSSDVQSADVTGSSWTPPEPLETDTLYFWRVAAVGETDSTSRYSTVSFRVTPEGSTPDGPPTVDPPATSLAGLIVYTSGRDHPLNHNGDPTDLPFAEFYAVSTETGTDVRISSDLYLSNVNPQAFAVSPDGTRIATTVVTRPQGVVEENVEQVDGQPMLYLVTSDGQIERTIPIPAHSAYVEQWSQDGTKILVNRYEWPQGDTYGAYSELYLLDLATESWTLIPTPEKGVLWVSASPTLDRVVFNAYGASGYQMWMMNADGSDLHLLSDMEGRSPKWSPDGTRIAFEWVDDYRLTGDIWVLNADGTNPGNLTNTADLVESSPSWSPDGTSIVFTQAESDFAPKNVATLNLATDERKVLATGGYNFGPQWVPGTLPANLACAGLSTGVPLANEPIPPQLIREAQPPTGLASMQISYIELGDGPDADMTLWLTTIDQFESQPLVTVSRESGNQIGAYAWSPDGSQIAYTTSTQIGYTINTALHVLDLATMESRQVAADVDTALVDWVGNTLTYLAQSSGGTYGTIVKLALLDMSDSNAEPRYLQKEWDLIGTEAWSFSLSLSPNGRYVAVHLGVPHAGLVTGVFDVETGAELTPEGVETLHGLEWQLDSSRLLFSANPIGFETDSIKDTLPVIEIPDGELGEPIPLAAQDFDLSPDGSRLAYTTPELWVTEFPAGPSQLLTAMPADNLAHSPDGHYILFTAIEPAEEPAYTDYQSAGKYVIPSQGGTPQRVLPEDGWGFKWRPFPAEGYAPVLGGTFEQETHSRIVSILWHNSHLYAATEDQLLVLTPDASANAHPLGLTSTLALPDGMSDFRMIAAADRLYLFSIVSNWFAVVDISVPAAPQLVSWIVDDPDDGGRQNFADHVLDIEPFTLSGRLLLLLADAGKEDRMYGDSLHGAVVVLDVTEAKRPLLCGSWTTVGRLRDIQIVGDRLIAGTGPDHNGRGLLGIDVLSVAPETFLESLSFTELPDGADWLEIVGDHIVANGSFFGSTSTHLLQREPQDGPVVQQSLAPAIGLGMVSSDGVVYVQASGGIGAYRIGPVGLEQLGIWQAEGTVTGPTIGDGTLYTAVDGRLMAVSLPLSSDSTSIVIDSVETAAQSVATAGASGTQVEELSYSVAAPPVVLALSTGSAHSCVLLETGGVKCWGWGRMGQLGDGTTGRDRVSPVPVDVQGLDSGSIAVSAGARHTCVLTDEGSVLCWGQNKDGRLGDGTTSDRPTPTPVTGLETGILSISAGSWHTCALTVSGGVKCWGFNFYGQVGDGSGGLGTDRVTPQDVIGLAEGVNAISAGGEHTCALISGSVQCWGQNGDGQLGNGDSGFWADRAEPVNVTGLNSHVVAVSAGSEHTCALTELGGVKCWGNNRWGQLGDGTTEPRSEPVEVEGLASGVQAISAGGSHTCALTLVGEVLCWGRDWARQLGDDDGVIFVPKEVELEDRATSVHAGYSFTCVTTEAGGVKCWGANSLGQLGNAAYGEGQYTREPSSVVGLEGREGEEIMEAARVAPAAGVDEPVGAAQSTAEHSDVPGLANVLPVLDLWDNVHHEVDATLDPAPLDAVLTGPMLDAQIRTLETLREAGCTWDFRTVEPAEVLEFEIVSGTEVRVRVRKHWYGQQYCRGELQEGVLVSEPFVIDQWLVLEDGWRIYDRQMIEDGDREDLPGDRLTDGPVIEPVAVSETPSIAQPPATPLPAAPTPQLSCPIQLHPDFTSAWNRAELGCPEAPASITWASYAPFERGLMIWRRDEGQIYGFFGGGGWQSVADTWDGSAETPSRGTPPPGTLAPERGFGNIWGNNDTFFNSLGWMLDSQKGFCALVQPFEKGLLVRSSQVEFCHPDNLFNTARDGGFGLNGIKAINGAGWTHF